MLRKLTDAPEEGVLPPLSQALGEEDTPPGCGASVRSWGPGAWTETVKAKSQDTRPLSPGLGTAVHTKGKEKAQAGAHRRANDTAIVQKPALPNRTALDEWPRLWGTLFPGLQHGAHGRPTSPCCPEG